MRKIHRRTLSPRKWDAFTLLEMLIVLTIIGILMAIGMATYSRIQDTASKQALKVEMNNLKLAIYAYHQNNNTYPTSADALQKEGFISKELQTDPWNTDYRIGVKTNPTGMTLIVITSAGPDKKFDTPDDIVKEDSI